MSDIIGCYCLDNTETDNLPGIVLFQFVNFSFLVIIIFFISVEGIVVALVVDVGTPPEKHVRKKKTTGK